MRLWLFVASAAPVALLVRQGGSHARPLFELIRWNLDTDTFTPGQWLVNKLLWVDGAALSPDGAYFCYVVNSYNKRQSDEPDDYAAVSRVDGPVPEFTARMVSFDVAGRWDGCHFAEAHTVVNLNALTLWKPPRGVDRRGWQPPVPTAVYDSARAPRVCISPGGTWIDPRGRKVQLRDGQVWRDGHLLYDTTDHVFCPIAPQPQ